MRYFPNLSREVSGCLIWLSREDQLRILACLSSFPYDLPPTLVELQNFLVHCLSAAGDLHD